MALQLDAGMLVSVIPLRTPERETALRRHMERERRAGALPPGLLG